MRRETFQIVAFDEDGVRSTANNHKSTAPNIRQPSEGGHLWFRPHLQHLPPGRIVTLV